MAGRLDFLAGQLLSRQKNVFPERKVAGGWLGSPMVAIQVSKLKPRKLDFQWRKPCIKIPSVENVMLFLVKPRRFRSNRSDALLQSTISPPSGIEFRRFLSEKWSPGSKLSNGGGLIAKIQVCRWISPIQRGLLDPLLPGFMPNFFSNLFSPLFSSFLQLQTPK